MIIHTVVSGNYFDGMSARPLPVKVYFQISSLKLESEDAGFSKTIPVDELSHVRSIGNDRLILNFNEECTEGVDITYQDIVQLFSQDYPAIGHKNFLGRVKGISNKAILVLLAAMLSLVAVIYFFVVPFAGEMATHIVSRQQEVSLGESIYESILKGYKTDTIKTTIVNKMADEIDFLSPYQLNITVVESEEKNAFALPGGHIVVFSALLNEMNDYPELIGLLAHEVSHVNHRHSLKSIFRNLSSYIFISVIFSDVNGISTVLIDNANKFKTLSYSRSLETEADQEGLKILQHNQVDPRGMLRLFNILLEDSKVPHSSLEFLSSHPLTENRIRYIEKQINQGVFITKEHPVLDTLWTELNADY
jgi:Zn-dependent protease with chaperone function